MLDDASHSQLALDFDEQCSSGCVVTQWCGEAGTEFKCTISDFTGAFVPGRPEFLERLYEVETLEIDHVRTSTQAVIDLPEFLPQVDGWTSPVDELRDTVAVSLSRVHEHGGWPVRSASTLRHRFHLHPSVRLVLLLMAADRLLEQRVWPERTALLDAIEVWAPALVVTPGLSMYRGRSALELRLAMTREVQLFELLRRRGIAAIPMVGWVRQEDRQLWARWVEGNDVANIALDAQCWGRTFRHQLTDLARFRDLLSRPPRLLVNGLTSRFQFEAVEAVWPGTSFTADTVGLPASGHRRITRVGGESFRVRVPKEGEIGLFGPLPGAPIRDLAKDEIERLTSDVRAVKVLRPGEPAAVRRPTKQSGNRVRPWPGTPTRALDRPSRPRVTAEI